ncbi:MAG: ATP-binding protein [Chloroflexi bacterium]|nr:ATP-binding protein [Chloroflexota bacterium]
MFYYVGVATERISFDSAQLLHLVGPALYADALAFLEELVRNSFNADASHVRLATRTAPRRRHLEGLELLDDGHGMSPGEVRRFFCRVGTDSARRQPLSLGGRQKMGGHGIGRFSTFAVCEQMELFTRCAGSPITAVRLTRDQLFQNPPRSQVEQFAGATLPPGVELGHQGTLIRLSRFHRPLRREQLVRRLLAKFTRDFFAQVAVEVDGQRLCKQWPEPHRVYRLAQDCPAELVRELPASFDGELVYVDNPQQLLPEEAGVALTVAGTSICVERVGLEASPRQALHLTGWVAVDHLRHLQNSSRTGFQVQAPEYQAALAALGRAAAMVFEREEQRARHLADAAETQALQSVLERIIRPLRQSLRGRVDLEGMASPGASPTRAGAARPSGEAGAVRPRDERKPQPPGPGNGRRSAKGEAPRRCPPPSLVVQGAYLGAGEGAPEVVLEADDQLIINLEHPLYRLARQSPPALAYHCARLVTQHLALRLASPAGEVHEVLALQGELMLAALAGPRASRATQVA